MYLSDMCTVSGNKGEARGYAKVNLTLDITGKRPDGYHDIVTIMRSVNLYDTITAELTDNPGIMLTTTSFGLPTDESNIIYKAAAKMLEETGFCGGAKIHFIKKIPCGAGMGGGSADGAAVLALLNRLMGNPLSDSKLIEIGASVGADIPFCLMCGTAIASGIGEKLEPIKAKGRIPVLIVKPEVSLSTPEMYKKVDEHPMQSRPDTDAVKTALEEGDIQAVAANLCNVMEPVAISRHPVIERIKTGMLENGALGAVMTGSGSAVFGIFNSSCEADKCGKIFHKEFKEVYSTFLI